MKDKDILKIFGPFAIKCKKAIKGRIIPQRSINGFWHQEGASDCAKKQGCYVFAMQAAKGYKPWYVGKATKGFAQECFTSHKLHKYNESLALSGKGTPVLFFIAAKGTRKKVRNKYIDQLETFLIHEAYSENNEIRQKSKIKTAPRWGIKGVIRGGKGKPTNVESAFATMMGL
ncbi:MAG: hypothetical protein MUO89_04920 [Dehalococcoidia bacterium]|nr:hypothetical protein [Dehalococcoidia bacterium]